MSSKQINFRYEYLDESAEFGQLSSPKLHRDRVKNSLMDAQLGFRHSQVVDSMLWCNRLARERNESPDPIFWHHSGMGVGPWTDNQPHVIPAAVQYHPLDWTDYDDAGKEIPSKKSIFERLNPAFLNNIRRGNAILLIDQSVEGYSMPWLWSWFHAKCAKLDINPEAIIYLTGDQSCLDQYNAWCALHNPAKRLKILPSTSLSMYIRIHYDRANLNIRFDDILQHKAKNKDDLYLFDCINMRPRMSRMVFFLHLVNSGLIKHGNVSMPHIDTWVPNGTIFEPNFLRAHNLPVDLENKLPPGSTPMIAKHNHEPAIAGTNEYYKFVERILADMYKNSWVSLVTESSFFQRDCSVFISEKSFKPIASMQPFITVGAKHSLKYIRKLGYKTFHPFIDESYDDLDDGDRMLAILKAVEQIKQIKDKVQWFASMRDILEHNHAVFMEIGTKKSAEHIAICNHYFNYFNHA